jgi:hypothetical protein
VIRGSLCLIALAACNTPVWNPRLPELSEERVPPGWSHETDIYARVLAPVLQGPLVIMESTSTRRMEGSARYGLEGRWPDSVKAGFEHAYADFLRQNEIPHPIPAAPVRDLALDLSPLRRDCDRQPEAGLCDERVTRVSLSAIGFSADSLYAVIHRDISCGARCGIETILLLRRARGKRWTIWREMPQGRS